MLSTPPTRGPANPGEACLADSFARGCIRHLARTGPGSQRRVVSQRCQPRSFRQQGPAAQADREVQQLRSAHPGQPGPQQGDRLAGGEGPRDRAQRPLGAFRPYTWLPRTHFKRGPGLDIGAAGGLSVTKPGGSTLNVPDAGAVHWSKPTSKSGGAGPARLPAGGSGDHRRELGGQGGHSRLPDRFASLRRCGPAPRALLDARPRGLHRLQPALPRHDAMSDLIDAGQAGAAGVIYTFDLPGKQVRGYYDPHVGTLYRVPAVFVGRAQAERLKALAAQGSSARVTVRAKVARKKTRNLIARLPGQSSEKIVLAANTDGNSWVQENGVIGMLAFARYYAKLPKGCHPRTLELVFSSAHDAFRDDGLAALPPGQEEDGVRLRDRAPRYARDPADRRGRRPGIWSSPAWPTRLCLPQATAMRCARRRSRRPSAGTSPGPRS